MSGPERPGGAPGRDDAAAPSLEVPAEGAHDAAAPAWWGPAAAREAPAAPLAPHPVGALDVLVVDDEPYFAEFLADVVRGEIPRGADATVRTASSPEAALEAIERLGSPERPLVVFSDYNLRAPMNGLELLDEVARRRPDAWRALVTGHAREDLGPALDAARLDAFVQKPFRLDGFEDAIARVLSGAIAPGAPDDDPMVT